MEVDGKAQSPQVKICVARHSLPLACVKKECSVMAFYFLTKHSLHFFTNVH